MINLILLAGGKGKRMNLATPKCFLTINNKMIYQYSLDVFLQIKEIKSIVIAAPKAFVSTIKAQVKSHKNVHVIEGGKTRFESVSNGLNFLKNYKTTKVLIHDAARARINKDDILGLIKESQTSKCVVGVSPLKDTIISRSDEGFNVLDRSKLYREITPSIFDYKTLVLAHKNNLKLKDPSDDLILYKNLSNDVKFYEFKVEPFKITTIEDLKLFEALTAND